VKRGKAWRETCGRGFSNGLAPLGAIQYRTGMKSLTIDLDADLEQLLDQTCRRTGRQPSEVARDALRRQLSLLKFEQLRQRVMPFAEARGFLTDEDVFQQVS
jgi:predicted transcriptional regulator